MGERSSKALEPVAEAPKDEYTPREPRENSPRLTLKLLTWNIWFDSFHFELRTRAVLQILKESCADFVALQEVTPRSASMLLADESLTGDYHISPVPRGASYFTLMLVRKQWKTLFRIHGMPSHMGRELVTAKVLVNNVDLLIATAHFESLDSRRVRKEQIEVAAGIVPQNWLLVGDFNFCSYHNFNHEDKRPLENSVLSDTLPPHLDCWSALRPDEKGYTFDSERNDVIRKREQMRYDRVLVGGTLLRPLQIVMVGTESLPFPIQGTRSSVAPNQIDEGEAKVNLLSQPTRIVSPSSPVSRRRLLYPSDHFGLLCTFQVDI